LNMSNVTVALQDDGTVKLTLVLDLLVEAGSREAYFELSRLPVSFLDPRIAALTERLRGAIVLEADGKPLELTVQSLQFPPESRELFLSPLAWPRTTIELLAVPDAALSTAAQLRIRFLGSFVFEEPIATTFVIGEGGRSMTRWLVTGQQSPPFATAGWQPQSAPTAPAPTPALLPIFGEYVSLGFLHILPVGIDHLLFVLGLCIGSSSFRRLAILISLFTLAHTLSLAAVSVGAIPASPRIVEPLILLTIMWVAVENLRQQRRFALSAALVLVFGLIHGMGFAGALKTIGLPTDSFFTALFGFNIGVELAQLTFIAGALLLLQILRRWPWYPRFVVRNGSLAIAGISLYWAAQMLR
jgi:hypothetical protein